MGVGSKRRAVSIRGAVSDRGNTVFIPASALYLPLLFSCMSMYVCVPSIVVGHVIMLWSWDKRVLEIDSLTCSPISNFQPRWIWVTQVGWRKAQSGQVFHSQQCMIINVVMPKICYHAVKSWCLYTLTGQCSFSTVHIIARVTCGMYSLVLSYLVCMVNKYIDMEQSVNRRP